ncbi:hypothetical protein Ciccas_002661 [Cichlidogyrus casuarinus]|uniref:Rho-GAP domain-containing protein n=1 Tax=Cichlidogyrus casuarinus TaxID=1844966 RepID=A0ABD2QGL6_9PLAT
MIVRENISNLVKSFLKIPPRQEPDLSVFGSNLTEICIEDKTFVPIFVSRAVYAIEHRGMQSKELYKDKALLGDLKMLQVKVNQGINEYNFCSDVWAISTLTEALKLFLASLSREALITECAFKQILSQLDRFDVENVRDILSEMPKAHWETNQPIFGGRLVKICRDEVLRVPLFVTRAIRAIERRGLDMEGLYRVPGSEAEVTRLMHQVDKGPKHYDLDTNEWSVAVITSCLKKFLRQLTNEGLITNVACKQVFALISLFLFLNCTISQLDFSMNPKEPSSE